jgi:hypothetical protein
MQEQELCSTSLDLPWVASASASYWKLGGSNSLGNRFFFFNKMMSIPQLLITFFLMFLFFFPFVVLDIESRASCVIGEHATTELHPSLQLLLWSWMHEKLTNMSNDMLCRRILNTIPLSRVLVLQFWRASPTPFSLSRWVYSTPKGLASSVSFLFMFMYLCPTSLSCHRAELGLVHLCIPVTLISSTL